MDWLHPVYLVIGLEHTDQKGGHLYMTSVTDQAHDNDWFIASIPTQPIVRIGRITISQRAGSSPEPSFLAVSYG